jgi:4-carboxymuconolactone decarboxylase
MMQIDSRGAVMSASRVEPLKLDELSEKQLDHVRAFVGPNGQLPNIFGVLLRNLALFEAWAPFGTYTMSGSRVDAQLREVLVLRTAANLDCDYEWHHHRRLGLAVGLTRELIDNIREGKPLASDDQRLMLSCADELAADAVLSDGTWRRMVERFGESYTMDVIFTVGAYTALAMGLKSCGVQLEARG